MEDWTNEKRSNFKRQNPQDLNSPFIYVPDNYNDELEQLMMPRTRLPSILGTSTVEQMIHEEHDNIPMLNNSCILIPRLQCYAEEHPDLTKLHNDTPDGFDPLYFNTLKFRF